MRAGIAKRLGPSLALPNNRLLEPTLIRIGRAGAAIRRFSAGIRR
jgi:hypothetical protein